MKRARKKLFSVGRNSRNTRSITFKTENEKAPVFDDINVNEDDKKNLQIKYFGKIFDEQLNDEESPIAPIISSDENEDTDDTEENAQVEEFAQDITPEKESPQDAETDEDNDEHPTVLPGENLEDTKDLSGIILPSENNNKNQDEDVLKNRFKGKTSGKKRTFAIVFSVSLAVILLASIFAVCMSGLFDRSENEFEEDYIKPVDTLMGRVNVLVLGVDKDKLRTDTIIIASIDTDNGKIDFLSIPRDTRMYIGSRFQKINSAHALSLKNGKIIGAQGSIEAVTRLTGIPINYYVEFGFEAFRDTIDAIGGVYYDIPQNMNYDDPAQNLHIHLTKGYQLLDGDKAEQLVRFRRYPEGDIKRVQVQQDFIKTVAEQKMNSATITKLPELYKTLSKNVKTSFIFSDMAKYAPILMGLTMEDITMYSLPGVYSGSEYAASYWLPDINEIRILVETVFGYDTTYVTDGKAIEGADYGKASTGNIEQLLQNTRPTDTTEDIVTENTPVQISTVNDDNIQDRPAVTNRNTKVQKNDTSTNKNNDDTSVQQQQQDNQDISDNSQSESDDYTEPQETEPDTDTQPPAETDTSSPVVTDDTGSTSDNGGFVRPGVNTD